MAFAICAVFFKSPEAEATFRWTPRRNWPAGEVIRNAVHGSFQPRHWATGTFSMRKLPGTSELENLCHLTTFCSARKLNVRCKILCYHMVCSHSGGGSVKEICLYLVVSPLSMQVRTLRLGLPTNSCRRAQSCPAMPLHLCQRSATLLKIVQYCLATILFKLFPQCLQTRNSYRILKLSSVSRNPTMKSSLIHSSSLIY